MPLILPDPDTMSQAEIIALLTEEERAEIFKDFTEEDYANLQYNAEFWLRPHQKIKDGDWFMTAIISGRGWGKGLQLCTPILTSEGWKTIGEIKDGDKVYDEEGKISTVTKAHPPYMPKKMYKITFSDKTEVFCDADHLWTTWTIGDGKYYDSKNPPSKKGYGGFPEKWAEYSKDNLKFYWTQEKLDQLIELKNQGHTHKSISNILGCSKFSVDSASTRYLIEKRELPNSSKQLRPLGAVKDTQEIFETQSAQRKDIRGNHIIPLTKPLVFAEEDIDLPLHPYVMGYMLGDGDTVGYGVIGSGEQDLAWLEEEFKSLGHLKISKRKDKQSLRFNNITEPWRILGLNKGKFVPEIYKYASYSQRLDLIKGMNDSDGGVNLGGSVHFTNTNKTLIDDYAEVLAGLGEMPRIHDRGIRSRYGVPSKQSWEVGSSPSIIVFRLPRKIEKQKIFNNRRQRSRMILSVEEVVPETVRCLSVDSPNNLFLITKSLIASHNTRTMSEWVRKKALAVPGTRIAVAGRTSTDIRRVLVEGDSGILAVHPPEDRPEFKQQKQALYWKNGSVAELLSSEVPDQARGPQFDYAVADEIAAWKTTVDSSGATLYSNLVAATRLGTNPQIIIATTPKRTQLMKEVLEKAKNPRERINIIKGSTFENSMLSASYIQNLKNQYGNSQLAKQELEGEMLEDSEGIVFTDEMLTKAQTLPDLRYYTDSKGIRKLDINQFPIRIIAVDPSVSADPSTADECGIVVIGATNHRDPFKRKAFVLEDASFAAPPDQWAAKLSELSQQYRTKMIVVEKNQGGDLLRSVIQAADPSLKVYPVTATKGKLKRAEPVVIAMQQQRVFIVDSSPLLIDQCLFYDPANSNYSPDRMDAFVWGITATIITPPKGLSPSRSRSTSAANRTLPNSVGTGRSVAKGSIRR